MRIDSLDSDRERAGMGGLTPGGPDHKHPHTGHLRLTREYQGCRAGSLVQKLPAMGPGLFGVSAASQAKAGHPTPPTHYLLAHA